jgi:hypothetical protein
MESNSQRTEELPTVQEKIRLPTGEKVKTVAVEITGACPLLHNRFCTEDHGENKSTKKKRIYIGEDDAEKALYRDNKGQICQPTEHIFGCLIKAATDFKFEGKKTYKDVVKRGIIIEPELTHLLDKKGNPYKKWDSIDARRAVIQRAAIIKWRPLFQTGWKCRFTITIIDEDSLASQALKEILDKAGYVGIGDYRPRFGRFQVTQWQENGKIPTK